MPRAIATRELLAPRPDVWQFLADPHNLADWWPGVHAVGYSGDELTGALRPLVSKARPVLVRSEKDADHFQQLWTSREGGKDSTGTFAYVRKK